MLLTAEIERMLKANGVYDVGFTRVPDALCGLENAVSIVVPLSDAVVDEIDGAPTHSYFHHYRTVNAFIDNMLLRTGLMLQSAGYRYVPVGASQTINTGKSREHRGLYSHKKAAVLAGLGTVGKSTLFLHRELGPRVRLGTLFTDCLFVEARMEALSPCLSCNRCADACPAKAIKGIPWHADIERDEMLDATACNTYMRGHFMDIGRGAVCGICMKVCHYKAGAAR